MPRGNRHRLAGYVWHITERCHRKQFLLKFARDRRNWIRWLYATAVDTEEYLVRCLVYIDLNMVRARVVRHPREWRESGSHEIQSPPERYRMIDRDALCEVIGVGGERLATVQNEWIDSSLAGGHLERRKEWSEAVAVGRRSFVKRMQEEFGARAIPTRRGHQRPVDPARRRGALFAPSRGSNRSANAKRESDRRFRRIVKVVNGLQRSDRGCARALGPFLPVSDEIPARDTPATGGETPSRQTYPRKHWVSGATVRR
jgi:hypothetical protein